MFENKIDALNAETDRIPAEDRITKRVYTVDEIIDILCISKSTAYNLVASNVFHSVRIGGQYRISKKSFDNWLDNLDADIDDCQVCD